MLDSGIAAELPSDFIEPIVLDWSWVATEFSSNIIEPIVLDSRIAAGLWLSKFRSLAISYQYLLCIITRRLSSRSSNQIPYKIYPLSLFEQQSKSWTVLSAFVNSQSNAIQSPCLLQTLFFLAIFKREWYVYKMLFVLIAAPYETAFDFTMSNQKYSQFRNTVWWTPP